MPLKQKGRAIPTDQSALHGQASARSRLPAPATDLLDLAAGCGIDKDDAKLLTYGHEFARLRNEAMTILEIGVKAGGSLRLWSRYFHRATIIGVDIRPVRVEGVPRARVVQGDQSDPAFVEQLAADHGPFGIVIDDGSHVPEHQIATFEALFPSVLSGGLYVCEDIHTSLTKFAGDVSAIDYFMSLTDRLMSGKKERDESRRLWRDIARVCFFSRAVLIAKLNRGPKYRVRRGSNDTSS